MAILPRQYVGSQICYDSFGNAYYCRSTWNTWGRWVALAVIIVIFFLFFYLCSCFSARRRRRANRQPIYGTGWAGRTPFGHGQATYNPNYETQNPQQNGYASNNNDIPPAYGGYYNQNNTDNHGYFGGRQTGTEMQPPQNVYRGADNQPAYSPPTGPPQERRVMESSDKGNER